LKIGKGEENDEMNKTEAGAVIKCLQKKETTPKEIHKDMVKTLYVDSLSYSTIKKIGCSFQANKGEHSR
jgi:hypothetical protein